jgi:hypothetical protein
MNNLNNQTKSLLAATAFLLLIYFLFNRQKTSMDKEQSSEAETEMMAQESNNLIPENMEEESYSEVESQASQASEASQSSMPSMTNGNSNGLVSVDSQNSEYSNIKIPTEDMVKYFPQRDYAPPTKKEWERKNMLGQKFNSRNKAKAGYKKSSYRGALRGNLGPSEWDDYFGRNNNVFSNSQTGENDKFLPVDETNGGFAVFKSKGKSTCGSNQNCEPEDLFDVDKYLPQEVNDDWFEVQPEPISVKNRHLINITKPIGVNTIGTSLKNASHDIRGTPVNPKFVVSPFLNSSIEPDVNLKGMY